MALARIQARRHFSHSQRLIQFLEYVVGQALDENASDVKECQVAITVFQRWASFDPRSDPVVRVEARRLRTKLAWLRPRASSVAILPFLNLTGDPKNDYLCDGLADELTDDLARVPGLRVVVRTSDGYHILSRSFDVRLTELAAMDAALAYR